MSEWNDNTDEILRGKLKYYASETPEHLWEKIDARRTPEEDTDEGIVGWWRGLGIGLLMLTMLGGFAFLTNSSKSNLTSTFESKPELNKTKTTFEQTTATVITKNDNDKPETGGITTTNEPVSGNNSEVPTPSSQILQINNTAKTIKIEEKEILSSNKKEPLNVRKVTTTKGAATTSPQIILPTGIEKLPTKTVNDVQKTSSKPLLQASLNTNDRTEVEQMPQEEAPGYIAADLATLVLKSKLLEETKWSLKESMSKLKPNCYNFRRAMGYGYYVDFFISPEYAFRSLKPKNSDFNGYADAREATESFRYAFSAGVRFSMVNQQGFTYRTGFAFSNITERFDYEGESTVETHLVPIDTIFNPGEILVIWDTLYQYPATRVIQTYNQFKMIDIPIILGYEFENEKFVLSFNGGAYFNILFKPKGTFLGPNLEPVTYTPNNPQSLTTFTERVGISAFGSIGFGYKIKHNVQLLIEPNFRYQLKPITIPSYTLTQKYTNVGIMLGMRYKF